ncbi:MAG: hypothetical protein R3A47_08950 [Polyangiales bacterium]
MPPDRLCEGATLMTRVIGAGNADSDTPAVFGKPNDSPLTCVGDVFDWQANLQGGWTCVAARVRDNRGNVNVSKPMRVCLRTAANAYDCGPLGSVSTPGFTCASGCIPEMFPTGFRYVGPGN